MTTRVIFMGTPRFAVPSMEAVAGLQSIELVTVISQPDRRAGRGKSLRPSEVKQRAEALGLPVWTPQRLRGEQVVGRLRQLEPDLLVVAAYGEILRPEVLEIPSRGALNVHASLLPRHRGAAPVAGALLAGDQETGVTIMKMDEGMDTGPILAQRSIPIHPHHTRSSLTAELSTLGADLLASSVPRWLAGDLQAQSQDPSAATYTRLIRKSDGELDWSRPARDLANMIRAFDPWPGTFTHWQGTQLKILSARPHDGPEESAPGTVANLNGELAVVTGNGWLIVDRLQLAGKQAQEGTSFLNGYPQISGAVLGWQEHEGQREHE